MGTRSWIALALAAASLAVFAQVLGHDFIGFDDPIYIVQNTRLRDGFGLQGLLGVLRPYGPNWIPLTALSLKLDYAAYGLDPAGFLATNAILHALNAVLLFFALSRMTGEVWRSGFVAAVFAVHPLHVESVAWANERKDVLSGLFWMLTLLAYARYAERPGSMRRYLLTLVCLALGLLAKPTLVTLPFVLLLLDYWPLGRLRRAEPAARPDARALRRALVEKLPMFALVAAASSVTFLMQRATAMADPVILPLGLRLANALRSYGIYARQAIWPSGLAMFYPYPLDGVPFSSLAAALLFVVGTSAIVARVAARRPYAPVGWLWYLGTLVPVIGLVQVGMQAHADRYMYLPLIGLAILVTWSAADGLARWRVPSAAVGSLALAVLLAFGVAAWRQVGHWRNSETLYRHTLAVTDDNFVIQNELATELVQQERFDEAEQRFAEAMRLQPGWSAPRVGLAALALSRDQIPKALRLFEAEVARDPDDVRTKGMYGIALLKAGRYAEARAQLLPSLAFEGGTAGVHRAMAEIEAALGHPQASIRHSREALRLAPGDVAAANNLAWTLATYGDPAIRDPAEAIRLIESPALASGEPWLLDTLAAAYAAAGRFELAVSTARRAAALAQAQGQLGSAGEIRARLALYEQGRPFVDVRSAR